VHVLKPWHSWMALGVLAALVLLLAADELPPRIEMPPATARSFTLKGNALSIYPGQETTQLAFSGGVNVAGKELTLTADAVQVTVLSSTAMGGKELQLPAKPQSRESVVREPGRAVAEMAKELQLPNANLTASAVKRVDALGDVLITSKDLRLTTSQVVSTDGGRSWAAVGRSVVTQSGAQAGEKYRLEADTLLFDTQTQRAVARGNVAGSFERPGQQAVSVSAQQCELDIPAQTLVASKGLTVRYGTVTLVCGDVSADFKASTLEATTAPRLVDGDKNLALTATQIDANIEGQQVTASGGVTVNETARGVTLTADKVTADLKSNVVVATGKPRLTYHDSTDSGTKITVRDDNGTTVIEVEGPQQAHINLDDLPKQEPKKPAPK
jgi:lipopolysaccharide export system protein LptA